jgi:WD40 repeat protein
MVMAVAVAPDGSWLASGGSDGTVRIWDAATGRQRATAVGHTSHIKMVTALAVAPDGSWLASSGADGEVRIWDVTTGRAQALMRVDNNIRACAWLGSKALAVGGPRGLYVFDYLPATSPAAGQ